MAKKHRLHKEERRQAIREVLNENPWLTDEELAGKFFVSPATIRLDRQMMGIPQMRDRIEQVVQGHPSGEAGKIRILDLEKGKKGIAIFSTDGISSSGKMIPASELYGAAVRFAEFVDGESFKPTQVGNIKYKLPVKEGTELVIKGKVALMKKNKKYIYISFFAGDDEVFRAKFIAEVQQAAGVSYGKDSR